MIMASLFFIIEDYLFLLYRINPGIIMAAAMSNRGSSPYLNIQDVSLEGPIFTITVKQKPIIIIIIPSVFFIIQILIVIN
ncbi:hypothetical protein DRF65_21770 [Chryseobacterium pennae]|uniref:Uncharacterized protein n=1 Tax=Chryseobacterium pennae TaxID=2258962 RepID=A0A3D9C3N2_9FLAO|nr:hypothetical protein DRF65_21770 [Chryseobacterium pennae]